MMLFVISFDAESGDLVTYDRVEVGIVHYIALEVGQGVGSALLGFFDGNLDDIVDSANLFVVSLCHYGGLPCRFLLFAANDVVPVSVVPVVVDGGRLNSGLALSVSGCHGDENFTAGLEFLVVLSGSNEESVLIIFVVIYIRYIYPCS